MIYSPDQGFLDSDLASSLFVENINAVILRGNYNRAKTQATLQQDVARIFEDEQISWGELSAFRINEDQTETEENYLFIVTDLSVKFAAPEQQVLDPKNPQFSEESTKNYKLVFFSNEQELLSRIEEFSLELTSEVRDYFASFLMVFMACFCLVMTAMLITMVNAITRPVIQLYELIKHIVEKGKGTKLTLTYKPTNLELNKLHLTFNYLAKTMMIAKIASQDEDTSRALLHYFEALLTFKEFKNWAA
jgi:hypothetical protein